MHIYEYLLGQSELADWWQTYPIPGYIEQLIHYFNLPKKLPLAEIGPRHQTVLPPSEIREILLIDQDAKNLDNLHAQYPYAKPLQRNFKDLPDQHGPLGAGSLAMLVWHRQMLFYLFEYARLVGRNPDQEVAETLKNLLALLAPGGIFVEIDPVKNFASRQINVLENLTAAIQKPESKLHCVGSAQAPAVYILELI